MLEWVETEPVLGARTWVLCFDGVPVDGNNVQDDIWAEDD